MKALVISFSLLLLFGCSKEVVVDSQPDWLEPGTNERMVFTPPVEVVAPEVLHEFPKRVQPKKSRGKRMEFSQADTHKVVKGECLWWIAEYDGVYGDPFRWPEIYKANRNQIKNPDLIYPGQELIIPRSE